ncbi:MAG: class I SAM-dependent methyltransferase [Pseudomonadota bacterium]
MNYSPPRYLFRRYEVLKRLQPGRSFVEIGAGNLSLTRELLEQFEQGLAVDFTDDLQESYDKLQPDLRSRLKVSNNDIFAEDIEDRFDCVVACEVAEHIENDRLFFSRVFAMLNPGGQAVISAPARMKYWSVHDELVGHLRRYEVDDVHNLANETGFTDVVVTAYGYPWINWLSHLRVWLAKRTLKDRQEWTSEQQTKKSNHQQIPQWLSGGLVPLVVNRFTVYPFALFSSLFNKRNLSDGYVVTMIRPRDADS